MNIELDPLNGKITVSDINLELVGFLPLQAFKAFEDANLLVLEKLKERLIALELGSSVPPEITYSLVPTDELQADLLRNFRPWIDADNRFGAGTWNRIYAGVATVNGVATIKFSNGNTLSRTQIDYYWNDGQNLAAVDAIAGL